MRAATRSRRAPRPQIWKDADRKARLAAGARRRSRPRPVRRLPRRPAAQLRLDRGAARDRRPDRPRRSRPTDLAHADVVPEAACAAATPCSAPGRPLEPGRRRWRRSRPRSAASASSAAASPLGLALREADRLAALRALAPPGQQPGGRVPGWDDAGPASARLLRRICRAERARTTYDRARSAGRPHPIALPAFDRHAMTIAPSGASPRSPRSPPLASRARGPPSPPRRSSTAPKAAPRASSRSSSRPARPFDAVVGADLQPAGRVRDRHDQHRARRWPKAGRVAPDGMSYTFKLRKGVKFHSNAQLQADARLQRRRRAVLVQPHGRPEPSVRQGDAGPDASRTSRTWA